MASVNCRVYNDSDVEIIVRIARIERDLNEFHQSLDTNAKTNVFQLDEGDRVFIAWDDVTKKVVGPVRHQEIDPTQPGVRVKFIGTQGGYDWTFALDSNP